MKRFAYLFAALAILASPLAAQKKINTSKKEKVQESYKLDAVEVEDNKKEFGKQTIGGKMLQMTPSKSDSITEALRGMSSVQFSYDADNSQTLGEIAPPRVSISGAKPYENNYMIDGLSITNTFNPGDATSDQSGGALQMPVGADQNIFIDTHLIEKINVYTSNVPAKYGNFVGGVIDAELKDPRTDRWHFSMESKYTQDAFFELRDVKKDSEKSDNQPRFAKWKTGFSADGPVNEKVSAMVSFSRNQSEIPLRHDYLDTTTGKDAQKEDIQTRKNDNFFTRFVVKPHDDLSIFIDGTYAPYNGKSWLMNYANSDRNYENISYRLSTGADLKLKPGKLSTKISFLKNGFTNDRQTNQAYSKTAYTSKGREYLQREGAIGDNETENQEIQFSTDFSFNKIEKKNFTLDIDAGLQMGDKRTDMYSEKSQREVTLTYQSPKKISGTSYNKYKYTSIFQEYSDSNSLTNMGSYAQAKMNFKKLELNPGLRFDYDSFSNNLNFSPRFSAGYDIFGNGSLKLIAGANRYYGSQLTSYAFKQNRTFKTTKEYFFNNSLVYKKPDQIQSNFEYNMDNLDTPYSDELMGGFTGSIFGFNYSFEYVHRNLEDQIITQVDTSPDDSNYDQIYKMTNNGSSEYKGFSFTLAKNLYTNKLGNHFFSLKSTKSKTKTSHGSFIKPLKVNFESKGYEINPYKVYYDGEFIDRSELPAENYNAPLILTFTMDNSFFNDRLRLHSVTTWRDSCKKLSSDKRKDDETPNGTTSGSSTIESSNWINDDGITYSEAYKYGKISSGFITNMTMEFDAVKMEKSTLSLILQVNNIFSNKLESDTDSDSTSHGRGYYLGCRATF